MIRKLLCKLGLHKWGPVYTRPTAETKSELDPGREKCVHCPAEVVVVRVMRDSDARKLGVSEEAIERGNFTLADVKIFEDKKDESS